MSNAKKTLQDKMTALDAVVEWFQGDEFQLEQAKEKLVEATQIADDIEKTLTTLTNDVTVLKQSFESQTEQ